MTLGKASDILGLEDLRLWAISSGVTGSNTNTFALDNSARTIVKLGFSVVAQTSVTIHFSTYGRSESCWALFHRWISSRKSTVRLHSRKFLRAFVMICVRSSFLLTTPDRWKNSASTVLEMRYARLVFHVPGGPQKTMETSRHDSRILRIGAPSQTRCFCPTNSSKVLGLSMEESGSISLGIVRFDGLPDEYIPTVRDFHAESGRNVDKHELLRINSSVTFQRWQRKPCRSAPLK